MRVSFKSTGVSLFYLTHLVHIGKNLPHTFQWAERERGREGGMGPKRNAQNLSMKALEHRAGAWRPRELRLMGGLRRL